MLSAIASMISTTIDLFLKINSSDARRRKFAKDIFAVYQCLDEIVLAIEKIETGIKKEVEIERPHGPFGGLFSFTLSQDIQGLNESINRLQKIMRAESYDLFQIQYKPEMLRAIEIFDENVVKTFTKAWFADGGFVGALHHLGLDQEIDGKALKLIDAEFNPKTTPFPMRYMPKETEYSLTSSQDIENFLKLSKRCRLLIIEARDSVKRFIAEKLSIEELL